ncbi:hypothetical protein ASG49_13025 [Marmoricola sp. Leaf446]|uniref:hypothetical protein n=1 Tax=Marmoricola sp. Leaf446 TaxID=1736379 RepID=UPI0007003091|nr:hypothetical protein [Marmoricola sp. Leaf446]KQT90679.1 hypothetical protein ASG49_13025 [Marmoricola sp. Leaf446]
MPQPLMWEPDDGPAARALRRALTRGVGLLYAGGTVLALVGARVATGDARLLYAGAGLVSLVLTGRCARGRLVLPDLLLLLAPVVMVNAVPDVLPIGAGLLGGLFSSFFLVGSLTVLTRAWGLALLGVCTVAWLLASLTGLSGQAVADALDVAALNTGMCVAEVVFLRSLVGNARVQDRLAAEQERLETETSLRDLEHASTAVVQRVLHDDVLSALRAVADSPAGVTRDPGQEEDVRRACRDAAAAVRLRTGAP